MVLVDTSVLVHVLRDRSGVSADSLLAEIGDDDLVIIDPVGGELLAGAKNEREWEHIERFIATCLKVEARASAWSDAARMYFDLRRGGKTVRKLLDCYIAQIALDHDLTLIHDDRDFAVISEARNLKHSRLELSKS